MFQGGAKISSHQALMLVIAGGIGTIYEVIATTGIVAAKKDAWITIPIAYSSAAVIGIFIIKLGKLFPNETIVQYLPTIFGKFFGKVIGLTYILICFFTVSLIFRANIDTISQIMPLTPRIYLSILIAILILYTSLFGFEVFARVVEFFMPLVIFIILTLILLNLSNININNLSPVLENGIAPLIKSIPTQSAFALETLFFIGIWFPLLNNKNKGMKILWLGMCICTFILTILTIGIIGFYGPDLATIFNFNFYQMSRYILIGNFFSGLDVLSIILWLVTAYVQILVFFYPTVIGISQWLNIKNYKHLIFPVIIISIVLSSIPDNIVVVHNLDFSKNLYVLFPFGLSLPIIYFVARLRGFKETMS